MIVHRLSNKDKFDQRWGKGPYPYATVNTWPKYLPKANSEPLDLDWPIDAHSDALDSPEKIAEMCELCLSENGVPPQSAASLEWTEGDNGAIRKKVCYDAAFSLVLSRSTTDIFFPTKGMFQEEIILYTLSHARFIEYDKIPNPDELKYDAKPVARRSLSGSSTGLSEQDGSLAAVDGV